MHKRWANGSELPDVICAQRNLQTGEHLSRWFNRMFLFLNNIEERDKLKLPNSTDQWRGFGHHISSSNVGFQSIDVVLWGMFSNDLILNVISSCYWLRWSISSYAISNDIPFFVRRKVFQRLDLIRWQIHRCLERKDKWRVLNRTDRFTMVFWNISSNVVSSGRIWFTLSRLPIL